MSREATAEFELVAPSCLRMVLTCDQQVQDIVEDDPRRDGAYAGFLGAVELLGPSTRVTYATGFPWDAGRRTAHKSLIKSIVEAAQNG